MTIRERMIQELGMLAQPSEQLAYEKTLAAGAGHASTELISGFCDDLFHPKSDELQQAFSEAELKQLAHLYGLMVEAARENHATVSDMLKDPTWRLVVERAKIMLPNYERIK